MYNLRDNMIDSILQSLKIFDSTFNRKIIKDNIEHISNEKLQDFYSNLFGSKHSYLNGMDRVIKVSEQSKPIEIEDTTTKKAKELIALAHSMNKAIFDSAKKSGRTFYDELIGTTFTSVSKEDLAILSSVKPHIGLKVLIGNIRVFKDGNVQLTAFKNAIKLSEQNGGLEISLNVRKMIGKG